MRSVNAGDDDLAVAPTHEFAPARLAARSKKAARLEVNRSPGLAHGASEGVVVTNSMLPVMLRHLKPPEIPGANRHRAAPGKVMIVIAEHGGDRRIPCGPQAGEKRAPGRYHR